MKFISYAQNFEDVMLWRALKSIENGFWIDVGAAHPTELSVTRAFSDRGWYGINIEPEPDYAAALRAERPRDINIEAAVAATAGRKAFYRMAGTGLSTLDSGIAANIALPGHPTPQLIQVEVMTLADICARYVTGEIHFLKIDAEGSERDVLLGADLMTYRPWVIVIEATAPLSTTQTLHSFLDLLTQAAYRQCWFDGLNAYFIAAERDAQLADSFRTPPNCFDQFVSADTWNAEKRAEAAENRIGELERACHDAQAAQVAAHARQEELERQWHEAQDARVAARVRVEELERQWHEAQAARVAARVRVEELEQRWHEAQAARAAADSARAAAHARLEVLERQWHESQAAHAAAEKLLRAHKAELQARTAELQQLTSACDRLQTELEAIRRSTSWRLTAPLRSLSEFLNRAQPHL